MSNFVFDTDKKTLTLSVGETFDLCIKEGLSGTDDSGVVWSLSNDNVSLYGDFGLEKALTAHKAGKTVVTVQRGDEKCSVNIEILPERVEDFVETKADFNYSRHENPFSEYVHGAHHDFATYTLYNHDYYSFPYFNDLKFKSMRLMIHPLAEGQDIETYYDWDNIFAMTRKYNVPLSVCVNVKETDENILRVTEIANSKVKGYAPVIIELFNEVYTAIGDARIPTVKKYTEWVDSITKKIKAIDKDIIVIAVGFSWDIETQWTKNYDRPVENDGENEDELFSRLKHWNNYMSKHCEAVDGITLHTYNHTTQSYTGVTARDFIYDHYTFGYVTYRGIKEMRALYDKPFYLTEWGCICDRMFWGTKAGPKEQKRFQWLKTPIVAIANLERLMNYIKTDDVTYANFHCVYDTQGFGIIEEYPTEKQVPNYYTFRTFGRVNEQCRYFYDVESDNVLSYKRQRPHYGAEHLVDLHYVEAWGFGDENDIKYVFFSNHTDKEQTVSLKGRQLSKDWSYGGTYEELAPHWMKNEDYDTPYQRISRLDDSYHLLPKLYKESYCDELTIPANTILLAKVK